MAKKTKDEVAPATELPIITSIGWMKVEGNAWAVLTIKTKGNEVVGVEVEEPNMKAIALETLQIKVIRELVDKSES